MIRLALSAILLALAGLHGYWGAGGCWPGNDSLSLARTVAGFRGIRSMPSPPSCFAVATILAMAALLPALIALTPTFGIAYALSRVSALVVTLVFLGRGIVAWLPAWRKLTPEQPFARLDRLIYGPLCLFIAALFIIVLF